MFSIKNEFDVKLSIFLNGYVKRKTILSTILFNVKCANLKIIGFENLKIKIAMR